MTYDCRRAIHPKRWLIGALVVAYAGGAAAQGYPTKSVSLVVAFPPGAANDIFARVIARRLTDLMGRQIVVMNRDGASGVIGTNFVAKSPADGYTLLWQSSSLTMSAVSGEALPYDPIKDFVPVGLVTKIPFLLTVHPSVPAKTVKELVAIARAQPGKLNYGSSGSFTFNHLATELLKLKANLNIVHVPYRGTAPLSSDLLGGQIDLAFVGPPTGLPHLPTGRLRALATTGAERNLTFPDIPTMIQAGIGDYEFTQWYGILAPGKTPPTIISMVNNMLVKALEDSAVRKRLSDEGGVATPSTSEEFATLIQGDLTSKAKLISDAGIRKQ